MLAQCSHPQLERITYTGARLTTLADDVHVEVADLLVCDVTLAVAGKRERREEPVDGGESAIKVSEDLSIIGRDVFSDFVALECPRGGQDSDFRHDVQDIEVAPLVNVVHLENLEVFLLLQEVGDLVFDHGNVGSEVFRPETELDEFLLFHEELVRAVVNDVLAEHGSSQVLEIGSTQRSTSVI